MNWKHVANGDKYLFRSESSSLQNVAKFLMENTSYKFLLFNGTIWMINQAPHFDPDCQDQGHVWLENTGLTSTDITT